MDESLCTAMQSGLGINETLESLEISNALLDADTAGLWCRAFSFVRANKALKSLVIAAESSVSAFRIYIAAVLQENVSLECFSIIKWNCPYRTKGEEYLEFIALLQQNQTLKTLTLKHNGSILLNDDEDQQMASLLKKNYALERLTTIDGVGDVGAILRLNEAGRRYLIEGKGSSISKGVDVFSRVISIVYSCICWRIRHCATEAPRRW
jgi:hypothetical protein